MILHNFASANKGVPCADGLRLYPTNLMRLVPPKGLFGISRHFHSPVICRTCFVPLFIYLIIYRNMTIYVNNQKHEVADALRVDELAASLQLPEQGVAVAVDNRMVPRTQWAETRLQPEARVVIIKAACGG